MKTVLGIDPGSRIAGYGAVVVDGGELTHLEHGVFRLEESAPLEERLVQLGQQLQALLERLRPDEVAVERVFLGRNADSAFKLGHARGVCLYEARKAGAILFEYAAREIKKAISGSGAATKEQVRAILLAEMGLQSQAPLDATDALALAVHHAQARILSARLGQRLREGPL